MPEKMADLPAMKTNPKFIFFTDFDGTITTQDSNDWLTDNLGYGQKKRKQENQNTLNGTNTFRESFKGMLESVTTPYNECIRLLVKNVSLDPGFKEYFTWSQENNIPCVVLSSGMTPIISAILRHLLGPDVDKIQIVSNHVREKDGKTFDDEDGWDIVFHDDSDFGHDKSLTLRPYRELPADQRPIMFYAGDGVSDLLAAREADLLFAKEKMDLVTWCVREEVPFTEFKDWKGILAQVKAIVAGEQTVQDAAKEGYEQYKRENPNDAQKE